MKDRLDYSYHDCIVYACDPSLQTETIISWLEKALEIDPEKVQDVLRIVKGLRNLSERTAGKSYIQGLEKRARSKRRKKRSIK